jgi:cystathionine beta-synthase
MMRGAAPDVLAAIGGTPIVKLQSVARHVDAQLFVKCEYLNPAGSLDERVAVAMVADAERRRLLLPGGTIVEATSGHPGTGLAMVAAVRGYGCIFVALDTLPKESIASVCAFGARVVGCPASVDARDPRSRHSVARRIVEDTPGAWYIDQDPGALNAQAHHDATAPEVWEQTGGEIDVFCARVGGGIISGCGGYFKERKPDLKIIGVQPIGSFYHEPKEDGRLLSPVGEDYLPTELRLTDEIVRVDDDECFLMTRRLAREEGLFCGAWCGAVVAGALKYARRAGRRENILVLLPDGAFSCLATIFDDEWIRVNGFLDDSGEERSDLPLAKSQL